MGCSRKIMYWFLEGIPLLVKTDPYLSLLDHKLLKHKNMTLTQLKLPDGFTCRRCGLQAQAFLYRCPNCHPYHSEISCSFLSIGIPRPDGDTSSSQTSSSNESSKETSEEESENSSGESSNESSGRSSGVRSSEERKFHYNMKRLG
ncbi:uncharacterized protein LOC135096554 [Scylla paramamosain]